MGAREIEGIKGGNPLPWLLGSRAYDLITDWNGIYNAFMEGVRDVRQ